ncbi:MAG TPA: hypothetical protein VMQ81_13730 [Acidimicrobiia bacterium]|nr:hypothetical protein [Acidimicrobiia bacterium]
MGAPTSLIDAPERPRPGLRHRLAGIFPPTSSERPPAVRIEAWIGLAVVAACCLFLLFQQQPHLLLRDTTTAGGDTGAHVWWPDHLRDHLLPHWRLAGWTNDFYAGFPAGQFYFPVPALLIVALDVVLPYNVAFKLVTALGPILLPVGAYVFGRGLRFPRPAPAAMALAATAFLFFKGAPGSSSKATSEAFNQRIMGGTLASNLAGEFSFTLALALALAFLGTLAGALDDPSRHPAHERRRRAWIPAALLAATVLSHLVVGVFAVVGALIVWLAHRPARNYLLALSIGGVGALLTAVWSLPLVATLGYTTDMGYETIRQYVDYLFPSYFWYLYPLAAVAVVAGVVRRRWGTLELTALTAAMALVFRLWDVFDTPAWNLRFLPFWYLGLFLLAAVGAAELVRGVAFVAGRTVEEDWWGSARDEDEPEAADGPAPVPEPRSKPSGARARSWTAVGLTVLLAAVLLVRVHQTRDFLDYWVRYNYTGYERAEYLVEPTGKSTDEYRAIIDAVDDLPPGRALWENDAPALGAYGTALSLMLLPYWTEGRIDSMEGLYYEAAATTPYLFLTVATLTAPGKASNPVRGLTYRTIEDFDLGVRYLQLFGVRYYMAQSTDAKTRADAHPDLELVAQAPDLDGRPPIGWSVYEVADAPLVEPLASEPVVVEDVGLDDWRDDVAVPWFDDPSALDRPLVTGGPEKWPRSGPKDARERTSRTLAEVRVTDIKETDDSISFRVSRTGVPVLVKTSYFPNWKASGADGPWRATPNLMVVVPTSKEVRLEYGTTTAEWLGRVGTVAGFLGLGALIWWPFRRRDHDDGPGTMAVPSDGR